MRDIPVVLEGYKLMVVDPPAPKTYTDERTGQVLPSVDRDGVRQFVVSLFVRQRRAAGQMGPKGEEIRVTLETDPGPGFAEDDVVALIDPRISPFQMQGKDGKPGNSGISFKARGLAPAGRPVPMPSPGSAAKGGEGK